MHRDHVGLVGQIDAAILAAIGAAVTDEMLGRGERAGVATERALQSAHVSRAEFAHDGGVRRKTFVAASPAIVLHDGQRRCEYPIDAGRAHLARGRRGDLAHERGIVRRTEAHVVRKDRRTGDDAVAVHRVGAPDERNLDRHIGRKRGSVIARRRLAPLREARAADVFRLRIAAVEHAADLEPAHFVGRDFADIGLGHLADLLLDRHAGDDLADARFHRRIGLDRTRHLRPFGEAGVVANICVCRCRSGGSVFSRLRRATCQR